MKLLLRGLTGVISAAALVWAIRWLFHDDNVDETFTDEERAAIAEANAALARGEFFTHEEIQRRHGLA